jgi:hypothetical protein
MRRANSSAGAGASICEQARVRKSREVAEKGDPGRQGLAWMSRSKLEQRAGRLFVNPSQQERDRRGDHAVRRWPGQAAAQFHIPEYLLRRACSEGRLEHLRVVNALWLTPATVAAFANSWRMKQGGKDT